MIKLTPAEIRKVAGEGWADRIAQCGELTLMNGLQIIIDAQARHAVEEIEKRLMLRPDGMFTCVASEHAWKQVDWQQIREEVGL